MSKNMKPAEIKAFFEERGFSISKSRGQAFLVDKHIAHRQIKYALLSDDDTVLEIGPGFGILTQHLAKYTKKVYAIEMDNALADYLEETMPGNVEIIRGDACKVDLPEFDKVVANLPYQISSPITFRLLEHDFDSAILMYQKEFAERMTGHAGESCYSRLSVAMYYKTETELLENVSRKSYYPKPRVDSAIVRVTPMPPPFEVEDEKFYFEVVSALFNQRRKNIRNGLILGWLELKEKKEELQECVPYLDKRVETLTPEQIAEVAKGVKLLL